ncbi:MAG: hypothetical protein IKX28_03535 [Bacteroidales bacterium]|nr:hypothetical protein [Bacteroidales bacterium]
MIRRIALTLLVFAAAAGSAAAQEKSPSNYVPGRELLAEETFQQLVDMSSTLDMMNLAVDVTYGEKLMDDHPDLWTAVLENVFFDYCNISDSLMTLENYRVKHFLGIKRYTRRSFPEWDELGRLYTARRAVLEDAALDVQPLHLVVDPLAPERGLPRLLLKKIEPLRDETVLRVKNR